MGLNIFIECNLTDLLKSNVGDLHCLHNEDEGILSRVALHLQWCSEKTEEPEKALFAMSEADYQVSYQIDLLTQVQSTLGLETTLRQRGRGC